MTTHLMHLAGTWMGVAESNFMMAQSHRIPLQGLGKGTQTALHLLL